MAITIIVTLEDGVQWHANNVLAMATSLGLRAEIQSILLQSGPIAEKPIVRVIARDGILPNGTITRHASAFPATEVFSGLPGVLRVETRDEPASANPNIPLATTSVAGEFFC